VAGSLSRACGCWRDPMIMAMGRRRKRKGERAATRPRDTTALPATISSWGRFWRCRPDNRRNINSFAKLRREIFELLEDSDHSHLAKVISICMMTLIFVATVCFVLESEATVPGATLYDTGADVVFRYIEQVSVIIFTVEYVLRLLCCPCENWGALRFVAKPENIIDLLACAPFWVTVAMGGAGSGLAFMRAVRLMRIFRIFKASKYTIGLRMFAGAMSASFEALTILFFSIILAVVILSSLMYLVEGSIGKPLANGSAYPAWEQTLLDKSGVSPITQQFCFGTIPSAFWWAVLTITTVGYGDCYPITASGKVVGVVAMFAGVLILALPITVVGSEFQRLVEVHQDDTLIYGTTDLDNDGMIDELELEVYLTQQRKEGTLRKDVPLVASDLLDRFCRGSGRRLHFSDFQSLKGFVIDPQTQDPTNNVRMLVQRTERAEEELRELHQHVERIEAMLGALLGAQARAPLRPEAEATTIHPSEVLLADGAAGAAALVAAPAAAAAAAASAAVPAVAPAPTPAPAPARPLAQSEQEVSAEDAEDRVFRHMDL